MKPDPVRGHLDGLLLPPSSASPARLRDHHRGPAPQRRRTGAAYGHDLSRAEPAGAPRPVAQRLARRGRQAQAVLRDHRGRPAPGRRTIGVADVHREIGAVLDPRRRARHDAIAVGPIAAYTAALAASLHGPRRAKERMLAEIGDGPAGRGRALHAAGRRPATAVERATDEFGRPHDLVRGLQRELTIRQTRATAPHASHSAQPALLVCWHTLWVGAVRRSRRLVAIRWPRYRPRCSARRRRSFVLTGRLGRSAAHAGPTGDGDRLDGDRRGIDHGARPPRSCRRTG